MKWKTCANRSLSIALTLALAATLGFPIMAWGEGDPADLASQAEQTDATKTPEGATLPLEADAQVPEGEAKAPAENARVLGVDMPSGMFSSDVFGRAASSSQESNALSAAESEQVATVTKPDGTAVTYSSLSSAFSRAKDGDTVVLLKDVPAANAQYQIGKSLTFDLNGHCIDSTKYATLFVNKYQGLIRVTIKNGTILNSADDKDYPFGTAIQVRQGVDLTLENVVIEVVPASPDVPGYGLRVGMGPNDALNPSVTVAGESTCITGADTGIAVIGSNAASRSSLVLESGTIEGGSFGIAGNGTCDNTNIEIKGGIVRSTSQDGCAIYHPQDGDLAISGGSLTGANGVQLSGAGTLSVSGGSIKATAAKVAQNVDAGSASILDGAALSIVSRGGGYGAEGSAEVSVSGGMLHSENNAALQEYAAAGQKTLVKTLSIAQAEDEVLSVIGGAGKPAVSLTALTGDAARVITGGTFSSDVSAYFDTSLYKQNSQDAAESPGAVVERTYSDADVDVEVPQPPSGESYVDAGDDAKKAAVESAKAALKAIEAGEKPTGMSDGDYAKVAGLVKDAAPGNVSVTVSLGYEEKVESELVGGEKALIEAAAVGGEVPALYFDLSVTMIVKVDDGTGSVSQEEVELTAIDEPMLFEVHVDPSLIRGKSVRIAHVHDGATEIIYPESVDREQGVVRFYASAFSTYALLTSDTVTVTFDSKGGSAVEAQTVPFGGKASKPADPTRTGSSFAGWYADESFSQAFDFNTALESSITLYAKWMQGPGAGSNVDTASPQSGKLSVTGDGVFSLAAGAVALVIGAGSAAGAAALHRRRR